MPARPPIVRKLPLAQLTPFARNARAALLRVGIADLEHSAAFESHIELRCCSCNAQPSPKVVAALFTGATLEAGRSAEELSRLRQEYCLRAGCDSRFYELTLAPHPSVDWAGVGTESLAEEPHGSVGRAVGSAVVDKAAQTIRAQFSWRLVAVGVALLALLVWRQWWTGGSIPFFREAKTFTSEGMSADTDPDDEPLSVPPSPAR